MNDDDNYCVHCKHYAYVENIASCVNDCIVRRLAEGRDAIACVLAKEINCEYWESPNNLTKEVDDASVQPNELVGNC